jgi:hypothetical protein
MWRGEAMRYLAELLWNPDALMANSHLDWRVIGPAVYAVATGDGPRRGEVRLILNEAGDVVRIEADDRPRLDGRVAVPCPWFARGVDHYVVNGRRVPARGEAGWMIDGKEFVYWRGSVESWTTDL